MKMVVKGRGGKEVRQVARALRANVHNGDCFTRMVGEAIPENFKVIKAWSLETLGYKFGEEKLACGKRFALYPVLEADSGREARFCFLQDDVNDTGVVINLRQSEIWEVMLKEANQ